MRTKNLLLQAALLAVLLFLPALSAQADPLLILTPPDVVGTIGTTIDVYGFVFNTGPSSITVSEISASMLGDVFGFQLTTDVFFSNPGFGELGYVLTPGEDTGVIPLFSVVINRFAFQDFAFEGFAFVVTLDEQLAGAFFTVTAVPEPATMTLLGTGLVGTLVAARRRRRAERQDAD
ncbi:MAG: PEP-CTERM sorting domain-containing protein [Pyrinomonadaceae bacterium]